jgi:hypothetical protein
VVSGRLTPLNIKSGLNGSLCGPRGPQAEIINIPMFFNGFGGIKAGF